MKWTIILFSLFMMACGATKMSTDTNSEAAEEAAWIRASSNDPELTKEDYLEGKQIYEANCQTCHKLKDNQLLNEDGWRNIVPNMVQKVNKREEIIDSEDEATMLRYLIALAR